MFGSGEQGRSEVSCVACGESVDRSAAREYDKEGDRWERTDKSFEYLCKPCHGDLCHQPRDGLEDLLVECDAGETDRETFLRQFSTAIGDVGESEPER